MYIFKMNKYFMYKTAEKADKVIFESNYTKLLYDQKKESANNWRNHN